MTDFGFNILKKDEHTGARAAVFSTPHGSIQMPVFAPVGTQAAVKTVTPDELEQVGASLILANTYHLFLRPGSDLVADMGGLHEFMRWPHPILTDSGGFQVFSLQDLCQIDEDGVSFRSYLDGAIHRFTPERAIEIQEQLGADIVMCFDECSDPHNHDYSEQAMLRTHRWAERCLSAHQRKDQALFGIVQGGIHPDLRETSARFMSTLDFPGYAIGGLSVGETKEDMHAMLDIVLPLLPEDKPHYLMGVGSPEDLFEGVSRGVDMFDCVLPTRTARNGGLMTRHGRINLRAAKYARDPGPIEKGCLCYTCQRFSRAYLRHLLKVKEILGLRLATLHNLYFMQRLMTDIRASILDGTFDQVKAHFLSQYQIVPHEIRETQRKNRAAKLEAAKLENQSRA